MYVHLTSRRPRRELWRTFSLNLVGWSALALASSGAAAASAALVSWAHGPVVVAGVAGALLPVVFLFVRDRLTWRNEYTHTNAWWEPSEAELAKIAEDLRRIGFDVEPEPTLEGEAGLLVRNRDLDQVWEHLKRLG